MTTTLAIIAISAAITYTALGVAIYRTLRTRRHAARPTKDAAVVEPKADLTCVLADMAAPWWLELTDSAGSRALPLVPGRVVVGSGPRADIRVQDPFVSGQHISIRVSQGGELLITDLDSTNGTFANGHRVARHTGTHGDRVKLGRTTLTFAHADGAALAAALD